MELKSPFFGSLPALKHTSLVSFVLAKLNDGSSEKSGDDCYIFDLSTEKRFLYCHLDSMSRKVASALTKRGFERSDVFITITTNICEIYAVFFGIMRLGGIIRPLPHEDLEESILPKIEETDCRYILCDAQTADKVLSASKRLKRPIQIFCFDDVEGCIPCSSLLDDDGSAFPGEITVDLDDTVAILATGGTTSPSKGACLTHRNCLHAVGRGPNTFVPNVPNDMPILLAGRTHHLTYFLFTIQYMIQKRIVYEMSDPNPDTFLRGTERFKIPFLFSFIGVMMWCTRPHKYDLSSVTSIMSGGATVTSSMITELKKSLPNCKVVYRLYGLTEGLISTATWDPTIDCTSEYSPEIPGIAFTLL